MGRPTPPCRREEWAFWQSFLYLLCTKIIFCFQVNYCFKSCLMSLAFSWTNFQSSRPINNFYTMKNKKSGPLLPTLPYLPVVPKKVIARPLGFNRLQMHLKASSWASKYQQAYLGHFRRWKTCLQAYRLSVLTTKTAPIRNFPRSRRFKKTALKVQTLLI